jgi:hypothetical protein
MERCFEREVIMQQRYQFALSFSFIFFICGPEFVLGSFSFTYFLYVSGSKLLAGD